MKKRFDYESTEKNERENENTTQDMMAKILQVIIGFIMAVLHM
ncbi:hypothetical protein [Chryseobacterium gallinarum]|nr:hypothetical protein [Chryseobacterium gallinarum]